MDFSQTWWDVINVSDHTFGSFFVQNEYQLLWSKSNSKLKSQMRSEVAVNIQQMAEKDNHTLILLDSNQYP